MDDIFVKRLYDHIKAGESVKINARESLFNSVVSVKNICQLIEEAIILKNHYQKTITMASTKPIRIIDMINIISMELRKVASIEIEQSTRKPYVICDKHLSAQGKWIDTTEECIKWYIRLRKAMGDEAKSR